MPGIHAHTRAHPGGNLGTLGTWKKGPELLLESSVILTVGQVLVNGLLSPRRGGLRPLPADASAGVTW